MTLHRPRRIDGFPYRGAYRYLLTFCTARRQRIFLESNVVEIAMQRVRQTAQEQSFTVLAHCIMPDHIHLLVEGTSGASDLQRFVKVAKQRIAYSLREGAGIRDALQEGYHDWVLRKDESTPDVIRYILNNPIRAGLVEKPEDYPFSGSLFPIV